MRGRDAKESEIGGEPGTFCMINVDEVYQLYLSVDARGTGDAAMRLEGGSFPLEVWRHEKRAPRDGDVEKARSAPTPH